MQYVETVNEHGLGILVCLTCNQILYDHWRKGERLTAGEQEAYYSAHASVHEPRELKPLTGKKRTKAILRSPFADEWVAAVLSKRPRRK